MTRASGRSTGFTGRRLGAALLATTMLTGATQAWAQSSATNVDELVVTAQKREENLQNVALSIQAIGTVKLEQLQVNDFNDFAKFLPSVSYKTAGPGFTSIYMRGVASGENGNHSGPLPSVGFYLDEQPVTTIQGPLDIHVYDIARVESLAGPQGTLYGASSQAGTIRIITNKPEIGIFKGAMDAEVNSVAHGEVGYGLEGFVNIPVTDRAAVRLVGWATRDAGYIDNVLGSRTYPTWGGTDTNEDQAEENFNWVDTIGARGALKINLNDTWTITPTLMAQDQKSGGLFAYDPRVGDLELIHYNPDSSHDRWVQAALTVEGKLGNFDLTYNGAYLKRRTEAEADYSDYSYAYDALYGYYVYDNAYNFTNPSQYIQQDDRFTKQSHELRISSPAENRFRFIAGVFYQRQTHDIQQRYKINNLLDAWEVPGWNDTIWLTKQFRTDIDTALFGEASFDITDKLTATAGIRLFKADNSLEGFFGYGAGYSSRTGVAACPDRTTPYKTAPCQNLDKQVDESGHTEKLNLTYQATEDHMIYATYSTGFRPGGVNRRGAVNYDADFLTNYEFGWKTTWWDKRLRLNGAVFFDKWEDFQFSYLGANGLTEIRNAGQAEMKGIEVDFSLRATDGLTISGSAAYTDAKSTEPYCPNPVGDPLCTAPAAPAGQELPVTPKYKSNLTARYNFPVGEYDAFVQGSVVYQSGTWTDLRVYERSLIGRLPAYTTVDLSAGAARDAWKFDVFVKNLTDERGENGRSTQCAISICADPGLTGPGTVYITPIRPRMIGVRLGRSF